MKIENGFYVWTKGEKEFIGKHFNSSEFSCQCKHISCVDQLVSVELVEKLDRMRESCKKPLKINSGYRCVQHNIDVGGKEHSSHIDGIAVDITCSSLRVDELIKEVDAIFDNVGVNSKQNWCHVDIRPLKNGTDKRRWYY